MNGAEKKRITGLALMRNVFKAEAVFSTHRAEKLDERAANQAKMDRAAGLTDSPCAELLSEAAAITRKATDKIICVMGDSRSIVARTAAALEAEYAFEDAMYDLECAGQQA